MQGTTTGLWADSASRLAGLERDRPEWHAWLVLLDEVGRALDEAVRRPLAVLVEAHESGANLPGAPLLQGQTLELELPRLQQLMHRLIQAAVEGGMTESASLGGYRPDSDEAVRLLGAAVRQDQREIGAVGAHAGIESGALASIAHLAALPVLQECGRLLQSQVQRDWSRGYCPICAAWPVLAERRGLDRSRWLRCARCAGAWEAEPLWCVYCGERDHQRLGSLVPDGSGEKLKVDTCESCRGYLKSVATLQALPPFELLLQDLETVELDLVAREREYGRPDGSGFELSLNIM